MKIAITVYHKNCVPIVQKEETRLIKGFSKEELIQLIWSRPNFAQVELTRNCNFRCKFCFENCDAKDKYEDMPPEKWKKVVDDLYDLGIKKIHFSGGENFLYPHFIDIVAYAKEKGLYNLINTNGSIDVTDILKYSDEFVFSLHGYGKVNDEITGFKGSFNRTVNNIEKALNAGKKVSVNTVLIKENFENYKKLYTYLESKFENLTYSPTMAIPCYTGKKFDSLSVPINKENMKKYLSYVKMIGKDKFVYKHGLYGLLGEELDEIIQMPVCAAGKSKLIIKYNGNVYPCNFFQTDEFLCGNVFEEDLKEIWQNGKGFEKFRKYYLNNNLPQECMNCKKHNNCFSGCRAWTKSYIHNEAEVKKEGDVRCEIIDAHVGA